ATSRLRPYDFTYPERRLTMDEMLYKFIDKGKREHEKIRAFICNFQTTNKILFKERNNSLIDLRFVVQELLKVINNTPIIDGEVKGVTTRGGKSMTQDAQNNDTSVHTEEPQAVNHIKPIKEGKRRGSTEEVLRKPEATLHKSAFHRAVFLNKLPSKEKDPGSFTIPCDIGVDDLDDTINAEVQELLANEEPDSFLSRGLEKSIDQSYLEGYEPVECKTDNDSDSDEPIRRISSLILMTSNNVYL
ncbi:hypothetical protein Tco_1025586, partial [Tanacetum coccineum]